MLLDEKEISKEPWDGSADSAVIISPPSNAQRSVSVFVRTKKRVTSNAFTSNYNNGKRSVSDFSPNELFVKKSGKTREMIDFIGQPTCVAIGLDHWLYMRTFKGSVAVL